MIEETFDLVSGLTTVVFGPNGSGKTTLLRRLFRDSGDDVAYLPQDPYLFRGLLGTNLGLGLTPEQAGLAGQYARRFGLDPILAEPAQRASGGERARLSLARTLARSDGLVLLDEPLASVDMVERPMMSAVIRDALRGRTGVVVTHELDQVVSLGDRMAIMVDGRIAQQGPVDEVMSQPRSDIVAQTVGVANVFAGTVLSRDESIATIDIGGAQIVGNLDFGSQTHVRVFVPAEAITLIATDESRGLDSARNRWAGDVTEMIEMARLIEVVVDIGVPLRVFVTRGSVEQMGLQPGVSVIASVKASAVRVVPR
jgi:molybdopterin-binding protein